MCVCAQLCLTLATPWTITCQAQKILWNFPGKNTGVGCHFWLQAIFPMQGSNPHFLHLLHWQMDSLPLHHLGSIFLKKIFAIHGWLNPWIWNSKTWRANCIFNFQFFLNLKDSVIFRVQILKYSSDSIGLKYLQLSTSPLRASVNKALLLNPVSLEWSKALST